MKRAVAVGFLVAALTLAAVAQHGIAKPGEANPSYGNDIWTGTVASVDPGTMTIILQGPGGEKFTGKLHKPLVVVDPNNQAMQGGSLGPGSKVEVFYVPKGQTFTPVNEAKAAAMEKGQKEPSSENQAKPKTAEDNFIYKIMLLDSGPGAAGHAPSQQQPPK